ncbi:type II toxin-antitoxin system RelE/ParE family toxin [uncultured Rhodospira sp.]|uniref:type II toxin-antitoxin system RelE/ParE family toxin n=1 Tax=uncultured Rhodospira sp. TaxID=1936189 RepID=UPI0026233F22|nr:type II toxin-antitoxin system RelE/ParE family toxin [uncultured Rhodospira sp.]
MIRSFRHKGLKALFLDGATPRIAPALHARCLPILDALDAATRPEDMNIPGWNFHGLRGSPKRWSVHVNGPWCVTFEFEDGDAWRVDLENDH